MYNWGAPAGRAPFSFNKSRIHPAPIIYLLRTGQDPGLRPACQQHGAPCERPRSGADRRM